MKAALSFFVVAFVGVSLAHAELRVLQPIRASTDVPVWNESFVRNAKAFAGRTVRDLPFSECRETLEIKGAFLCAYYSQDFMNAVLARASWFIEGSLSSPKGSVARFDDPEFRNFASVAGGHDLRGEDLAVFYKAVQKACAQTHDKNICFNQYEEEVFNKLIIPASKTYPHFVIITFAVVNAPMNWADVVTHEIMHAQYFNDDRFRAVVDRFWKFEVSDRDKRNIVASLRDNYDPNDELLMKNEFQAYILMANAERHMLKSFVNQFRAPLQDRLRAAGVQPVQVSR